MKRLMFETYEEMIKSLIQIKTVFAEKKFLYDTEKKQATSVSA